jgi:hypothetical protein
VLGSSLVVSIKKKTLKVSILMVATSKNLELEICFFLFFFVISGSGLVVAYMMVTGNLYDC